MELDFFGALPNSTQNTPSIMSSMQSLETCFCLIALNRFPHALTTCASAIETALKAAVISNKAKKPRFEDLIAAARHNSVGIANLSESDLVSFRRMRNNIVHHGFEPKDHHE